MIVIVGHGSVAVFAHLLLLGIAGGQVEVTLFGGDHIPVDCVASLSVGSHSLVGPVHADTVTMTTETSGRLETCVMSVAAGTRAETGRRVRTRHRGGRVVEEGQGCRVALLADIVGVGRIRIAASSDPVSCSEVHSVRIGCDRHTCCRGTGVEQVGLDHGQVGRVTMGIVTIYTFGFPGRPCPLRSGHIDLRM